MKKLKVLRYLILGFLLLNMSCKKPVKVKVLDLKAVHSKIVDRDMFYEKAYNNKNLDDLVSYYSEDAILMAPNEKKMEGLKEIRKFYGSYTNQDSINYKIKLKVVDVTAAGDLAIGTGLYQFFYNDTIMVDNGKYLAVFKKNGKIYKCIRDIWNSSKALK